MESTPMLACQPAMTPQELKEARREYEECIRLDMAALASEAAQRAEIEARGEKWPAQDSLTYLIGEELAKQLLERYAASGSLDG